MKVDIHVIPTPGFDDNFERLVEDLQHPMINIQVAEYVEGNMLEARWRAYNLGTAPYVSFVDGDDGVLDTSWIDVALMVLEEKKDVSAVYPRWQTTKNGRYHKTSPNHFWTPEIHKSFMHQPLAHHLTIMRRENVLDSLSKMREKFHRVMKSQDRYLISSMIKYGRLIALSEVAYEWRLREGTARSSVDPPEVMKWIMEQDTKPLR